MHIIILTVLGLTSAITEATSTRMISSTLAMNLLEGVKNYTTYLKLLYSKTRTASPGVRQATRGHEPEVGTTAIYVLRG